MKRIRIIAIIAALITTVALYFYLADMKKPETIERTPVVVAAAPIVEGQTITDDMVAVKMIPMEAFVNGAATSKVAVVGSISSTDVAPGQQIISSDVFKAGETKSGLAYTVERGKRAITIPVDQVSGVAGFLKPEDSVDVLAIIDVNNVLSPEQFNDLLKKKQNAQEEPEETAASGQSQPLRMVYSMILLQDIKVLATGQVMKRDDNSEDPVIVETVTLSVTPEQALRLNLVLSEGNVRLIMRSPGDNSLPDLEGVTVANLIDSRDIDILTLLGEIAPTASPKKTKNPDATASPESTASPAK